jgi:hypothetical protein
LQVLQQRLDLGVVELGMTGEQLAHIIFVARLLGDCCERV